MRRVNQRVKKKETLS